MNIEILKQMAPIPKMENEDRFLFIGPHPDDIEIACGGFVSKLTKAGKKVFFLIVTDGGSGSSNPEESLEGLVQLRKNESALAAASLGVEEIYHLDFPDGGEYDVWDVAKKIARIILECNPDVVISPDPGMPSEMHPDHTDTGKAAARALLLASFPLMAKRNNIVFPITKVDHFHSRILGFYYTHRVNQVIDLSQEEVLSKINAIQKHASQFLAPLALETILFYLQTRGDSLKSSPDFASSEGYFVMGSMHQHCFPEINLY